jgi:hypothetical protein
MVIAAACPVRAADNQAADPSRGQWAAVQERMRRDEPILARCVRAGDCTGVARGAAWRAIVLGAKTRQGSDRLAYVQGEINRLVARSGIANCVMLDPWDIAVLKFATLARAGVDTENIRLVGVDRGDHVVLAIRDGTATYVLDDGRADVVPIEHFNALPAYSLRLGHSKFLGSSR